MSHTLKEPIREPARNMFFLMRLNSKYPMACFVPYFRRFSLISSCLFFRLKSKCMSFKNSLPPAMIFLPSGSMSIALTYYCMLSEKSSIIIIILMFLGKGTLTKSDTYEK
jgi:hypothetical protein